MRVIVGSENPTKVQAVQTIFSKYDAEIIALNVESGVSEQPFSDEETMEGALNRAYRALDAGKGDIGIGLEGGVHMHKQGLFLCNWGALVVPNKPPVYAGGARILLPIEISERLLQGEVLGMVMDEYASKKNVSKREGAIGILSNEWVNRSEMFSHTMRLLVGQYEYRELMDK